LLCGGLRKQKKLVYFWEILLFCFGGFWRTRAPRVRALEAIGFSFKKLSYSILFDFYLFILPFSTLLSI